MTYQRLQIFDFTKDTPIPKAGPPFLVDGILHRSQTIVYGMTNAGKSMFAVSLGLAVASGRPWNGRTVSNAGPVAIVSGDPDGMHETAERLDRARADLGDGQIRIICPDRPMARETWFQLGQATEGCRLLILDNLTQFVPGSLNDDNAVKLVYEELQGIARSGIAVCVLAHTSDKKNEWGYSSDVPLGSTVIRTAPRWFVYLKRTPGKGVRVELSGNSGRPWEMTISDPTDTPRFDVLDMTGADELAERRAERSRERDRATLNRNAQIADYVNSGHTQAEAAEKFRVSEATVSRAMKGLRKAA